MTKNWMTTAVMAALALGVGCGDDDSTDTTTDTTTMDMGGEMPSIRPDGLPPASLGEGGVGGTTAMTTTPADFSCLGTRTAPTGGADHEFSLQIREFNSDMAFEGLRVCFFPDNNVSLSGCTGQDVLTDASGNATVTGREGGWYAYRVFPSEMGSASTNIQDSIQINELTPTGDTADGSSISEGTLGLIPAVLGFSAAADTALVAGIVEDCAGAPVYGSVVRMYDEAGNMFVEQGARTAPKYRYFNGDSFPSADQPWTHVDGLYAAANIPVAAGGATVTVEVWGEIEGTFQVIGCETVPALPNAISIVNVGPRRADGPTCPGQM